MAVVESSDTTAGLRGVPGLRPWGILPNHPWSLCHWLGILDCSTPPRSSEGIGSSRGAGLVSTGQMSMRT